MRTIKLKWVIDATATGHSQAMVVTFKLHMCHDAGGPEEACNSAVPGLVTSPILKGIFKGPNDGIPISMGPMNFG